MRGIYLAACKAYHENHNIDYNDVVKSEHINIIGDMLNVDLSGYDYVIATPPCNYYSRMNHRRDSSKYALATKHLLPSIIDKLCKSQVKYWLVENVRNSRLFNELGLYDFPCFVYIIGRHTYWTNCLAFNHLQDFKQRQDFLYGGITIKYDDMKSLYHEGGYNVHQVVESFIEYCEDCETVNKKKFEKQ